MAGTKSIRGPQLLDRKLLGHATGDKRIEVIRLRTVRKRVFLGLARQDGLAIPFDSSRDESSNRQGDREPSWTRGSNLPTLAIAIGRSECNSSGPTQQEICPKMVLNEFPVQGFTDTVVGGLSCLGMRTCGKDDRVFLDGGELTGLEGRCVVFG